MIADVKSAIDSIAQFLGYTVFTVSDQPITLGGILLIPLLLGLGFWLINVLARALSRKLVEKNFDPNIVHLLKRLVYVIGIIVLTITVLDVLNVPITAFAFLSGAIAIGFGFGAQNIINNFISGWILMWEKPIRIGDFLEVEEAKGTVEQINTRSTRIRRVDGVHMLIPNSKLLENTVVNWTLVDRMMRTTVRVGVAYGSPVRLVADLIQQATEEHSSVLKEPKPQVTFEDFGDNALVFDVFFWMNSPVEGGLRITRSDIRFRITELFEQNNIVIAYPQRDVHLDGEITIVNSSNK